MFVRAFEGDKDSIKSVAKLLKREDIDICIRKVDPCNFYAVSVHPSAYVESIELASKKLPEKKARGLDVVYPDGYGKLNLHFLTKIAFTHLGESNMMPIFGSENEEQIERLTSRLRAFNIEVQDGLVKIVWVDKASYVYALLLGSDVCVLDRLNSVYAIAPDRVNYLDIQELSSISSKLLQDSERE